MREFCHQVANGDVGARWHSEASRQAFSGGAEDFSPGLALGGWQRMWLIGMEVDER